MPTFVKKENETNKAFAVYYADTNREIFATAIQRFFEERGYKLKEGEGANGVYEKGDRTMRLLLGAFYKYFKFKVHTEFNGVGEAKLTLVKATSGMSGGAIGVKQVKNEIKRLENELQEL